VLDRVIVLAVEAGTEVGVAVIVVLAGMPGPVTGMPTNRLVVSTIPVI